MIVLDTNTVSAVMRGDERVRERLLAHPRGEVTIPQPVIAEIEYGLARLPVSRRRAELEERWAVVSRELRHLDWTDEVSEMFGSIKAELERRGRPIDDFDVAIAAHALAYDAVLISNNLPHLERVPGIEVEDWLG